MRQIYLLIVFVLLSGVFLSTAAPAFSAISGDIKTQLEAAGGSQGADVGAPKDPRLIVANIIKVALEFLGMIFFVLTLYAGFLWMTAGGNEEQVGKAKSLLTQAVIGLTIVLSAYSITRLAIRFAKGQYTDYWDGRTRRVDFDKAPICGVGTGPFGTTESCPDASFIPN